VIVRWSFGEDPVLTLAPGFQWTMRVKRIVDEVALSAFATVSFVMKSSEARPYDAAACPVT